MTTSSGKWKMAKERKSTTAPQQTRVCMEQPSLSMQRRAWLAFGKVGSRSVTGVLGNLIVDLGFESTILLSLNPSFTFSFFQLYRRFILRGQRKQMPSPLQAFLGAAFANSLGWSHINSTLPAIADWHTICILSRSHPLPTDHRQNPPSTCEV